MKRPCYPRRTVRNASDRRIRKTLCLASVAALLLTPKISQAQVFFGAGGSSNTASKVFNLAFGFQALFSNTTGNYNIGFGYQSLSSNTTGNDNTAIGVSALSSNTTGSDNIANGTNALLSNTTGSNNIAIGTDALIHNTTGTGNTANGFEALYANDIGVYNTANGYQALFSNTSGDNNTANGLFALYSNTTGASNVASGSQALLSNTAGSNNTASGRYSLYSNTTGSYNTAAGWASLGYNTTGSYNTADGYLSLYQNTVGAGNAASGYAALNSNTSGNYNVGMGQGALYYNTTGSYNIGLGYAGGVNINNGSYNIAVGNAGTSTDNGVIRIGTPGNQFATFVAGINGVTASGGVAVYVNQNGQLGTLTSSRRFKNDIKDMGNATEKLMKLRPVTFRYKDTAEKGKHNLQYGLIAEEVAKVYPDLVQYDKAGKPFTIYYHLLTPMLLNELQKAHRSAAVQKAQIGELRMTHKAEIAALKSAIQAQYVELTELRLAQAQQMKAMEKLAALIPAAQTGGSVQRAVLTRH